MLTGHVLERERARAGHREKINHCLGGNSMQGLHEFRKREVTLEIDMSHGRKDCG